MRIDDDEMMRMMLKLKFGVRDKHLEMEMVPGRESGATQHIGVIAIQGITPTGRKWIFIFSLFGCFW